MKCNVPVPLPADLVKSSVRFDAGIGAVPGGDPIGNGIAGPIQMEPPPVEMVAVALSGNLIVVPAGGKKPPTAIAVPEARLDDNVEPAPRVTRVANMRIPWSEEI